jgi:hypothetical protein
MTTTQRPDNTFLARALARGLALGLLAACGLAAAQDGQQPINGIYTCVDAQGRKLTSDRPIASCVDREQKVLNPSGTVKARIGPTLTTAERAEQEAREKKEAEERFRQAEEKRRDRALLARYPNQAAHDKERADALAQLATVRQAAISHVQDLLKQRQKVDDEMEFYKKDPSKAPPQLRRQSEEVAQSLAAQGRFLADQDAEIKRVNARFDEELTRLKQLWALQGAPAAAAPSGTKTR